MPKDTSIPRPNELQFCCGALCDAQANMDYVKQLEAKLIDLEDRNLHLVSINTHVTDKNDNLLTERDLLRKGIETLTGKLQLTKEIVTEMAMTIKARDRALRLCRACQGDGRIKSDY